MAAFEAAESLWGAPRFGFAAVSGEQDLRAGWAQAHRQGQTWGQTQGQGQPVPSIGQGLVHSSQRLYGLSSLFHPSPPHKRHSSILITKLA